MGERYRGRRSSRDTNKDSVVSNGQETDEEVPSSDTFTVSPSNTSDSVAGSDNSGVSGNVFDVAKLADLPRMTSEQMKGLETQIQKEFKQISKQYLKSRLTRVKYMVDNLDTHINQLQSNNQLWTTDYEGARDRIESMRNTQEEKCLGDPSKSKRLTQDLKDMSQVASLIEDFSSPFNFDNYLRKEPKHQLPFNKNFDKIISGFSDDMNGLVNEHNHQLSLLEKRIDDNKMIIWLEYRNRLVDSKNKLLNDHLHELTVLEDMEKSVIDRGKGGLNSKQLITRWDNYHHSTIKPHSRLDNKDTRRLGSSNISHTNKIELTHIKQYNLNNLNKFTRSQQKRPLESIDSSKRIKLSSCSGLDEDEIDDDLMMLRNNIVMRSPSPPPAPQSDYEEEEEIDNEEIDESNGPVTPTSEDSHVAYYKLLNVNHKISRLPPIPSIEKFG